MLKNENQSGRHFALVLEVINVHRTNQIEFLLSTWWFHTKCVTVTKLDKSQSSEVGPRMHPKLGSGVGPGAGPGMGSKVVPGIGPRVVPGLDLGVGLLIL